ncbi:hypothetical protein TNIN_335961 [Trichonephila inaurata madagascariensis]|uniref:RING-type domain-containing protein n=1 Tax=Trichonephila inaurata madagascariensis TaxID=2747483 RepID=A0A8X6WM61_9ARAC|nr:hypothetical protein TNIN_335961 [Trichonephila inaurata madagascariensis]
MEDEKAFALQLAIYQGADLGDYINFMIQFRSSLNALKPADVIALEPIYTVDLVEQMQQLLPHLDPREIPTFQPFVYFEPADVFEEYLEQEASKGKGAFIDAVWIVVGKPKLYHLVHKAWTEHGPQTLAPWIKLAQIVLNGCYGQKWPDSVFQVPESCPICLSPIHWPQRTQCGHVFHKRCLSQHLDIYTTCPLCRASLRDP